MFNPVLLCRQKIRRVQLFRPQFCTRTSEDQLAILLVLVSAHRYVHFVKKKSQSHTGMQD